MNNTIIKDNKSDVVISTENSPIYSINIKDSKPNAVIRLKNEPIFETNIKEWERAQKISKICYNVGDNCVFVITRGNKKMDNTPR